LKEFKAKDQGAKGAYIQGLKLIKSGVNLKQINSLKVNKGQIA